jgi:hypothetical protein
MKGTFIKALSLTLLMPAFSAFAMGEDTDVIAAMREAAVATKEVAAPVVTEVAKAATEATKETAKEVVTVVAEGAKALAEGAKEVATKVTEVVAPVAEKVAEVATPAAQTVAQTVAPVITAVSNTVSGAVAPAVDAAVKTVAPDAAKEVAKTTLTNAASSAATNVAPQATKTVSKEAAQTVAKQSWKDFGKGLWTSTKNRLGQAKDGVVAGSTYVWNSAKAHPYIASTLGVVSVAGLGYLGYTKIKNRKVAKAINALPANVKAIVVTHEESVAKADKLAKAMTAEKANKALYDAKSLEEQIALLATIKDAVKSNATNPQQVKPDTQIMVLFGNSIESLPTLIARDVTLPKIQILNAEGKPSKELTGSQSLLRDMKRFDEAVASAADARSQELVSKKDYLVRTLDFLAKEFTKNLAIARNAAQAQPAAKAEEKPANVKANAKKPADKVADKAAVKPADKPATEQAEKPGMMKRSLNFVVADLPTWKSRGMKAVALTATAGTAFWLGKGKVVAPAA